MRLLPTSRLHKLFARFPIRKRIWMRLNCTKPPQDCCLLAKHKLPWDDAVTLALTYAEIPYDVVYDLEVMEGVLPMYDWLHLHHEDFTGQYGKFWRSFRNAAWYQEDVRVNEEMARLLGYSKVSQMKLAVAKKDSRFCGRRRLYVCYVFGARQFRYRLSCRWR